MSEAATLVKSKITAPTGEVLVIEHAPGLSKAEIVTLARQQRPTAMAETVSPETKGLVKPSVGEYLKTGLKNRAGDIGAMIGGAVAPGKGALGLASRVLGAEVGQEGGDALGTGKVTPGYGAASQVLGEGVTAAVRPLFSPSTYRGFASKTATAAADWLKEHVPAWRSIESNAKGLYDMAHGQGQRLLSGKFDGALGAIRDQVMDRPLWLPADDIKALKLQTRQWRQVPGYLPNSHIREGEVSAGEVIDSVTGLWKKNPRLYRRTVDSLTGELDQMNLGDAYGQARAEYANGAGWIKFAEQGKFLYGEHFEPARAMESIDKFGKELTRRGMDELRAILRGSEEKPIQAVKQSPWGNRLKGATVGEIAGWPFGVRGAGAIAGGAAGEMLPRTTYKNVPLSPAARFADRVAPAAVAEGAREADRQTVSIKDELPKIEVSK